MSTLETPSAQTKYGPDPTATRIVSGSSDYIHPDVPSATGVASVVLRQAHHQHEPQAVAVSPDIDYIKVCPDLPVAPD